ncbi:protein kinase domain-containing protein [Hyalangium rubrum]|uniref:Protein kinase n=1 Tax=Hyalangium rubrum TaxID=3103134 RepID=A0ABU5H5S0_9BACT|nr:protein kinase [Hyalangium sp. s54d21]MDY7228102.1 protein kinase [Hyalangium sp. s54d21]
MKPPSPLPAEYEDELHLALIEGVLSREQLEHLRAEAVRLERSPLELMLERGQVSPETLSSLREEVQRQARAATQEPATQKPGSSAPATPSEPVFPLPHWDRYQPVRFLGQGGMGQVFLAYDPRLRRNVALKFVRDGTPELSQRFLSEARAQARVHHERVCEMYEVGEVQGRAYIAMQYVEGRHLGQLASELTLEQKILVMRDVAEGVHAAHRAGLIHRDLKPSNILVERTEDGGLKPYVMDFGLARDWRGENTATGAVLGTPHYMAPEQARGEVSRLDRRVDVYSLGATLYQVLVGQPPFSGINALEVVSRIQSEEPRSPRALDPDIPVDLEAITLKCLEKERSARYDSARALAEDLERFLGGEPVQARPAGVLYRLRKKVRKHRIAVALGSAALLVVMLALGQSVLARREVTLRERLSRRFTELVERIEAMARYSAMAPLHDTRGDRQAILSRMGELETEVRQGGARAEGPGNYAVGRALLALGDTEGARAQLESAWQRGYREARVAYALALALGQLYQEHLLEVERIRNADQREARRREIERHYRDPALVYLRQSQGAEELSPEYVAALLAFYEGRYDEALSGLEAMRTTNPWFYEAPLLRGDIFLARALQRKGNGDRTGALADLEAARQAQAVAADIGESLPVVYYAMARLEHASLVLELYGQGEIEPAYQRGLEALSRALTASPDHFKSMLVESRLHRRMAEQRIQQGGEVQPLLDKALAATRAAQALAPEHPWVHMEMAQVLRQWARYRQEHSEDPGEQLRQTIESLERIKPEDRDYAFHLERGLAFKVWADAEEQRGEDSLPRRGQAIDAYLAAIQLEPAYADAWINLGTAYFKRASSPRAGDAHGDLQKALEALAKARSIDPGNHVTYFYEGQVYETRARRSANRDAPTEPDLSQAIEMYRKGQAINGKLPQFPNVLGLALVLQAQLVWDEGGDALPVLDQAQAAFEQARTLAPQQAHAYNNLGEVHDFRAAFLRRKGVDSIPSARLAVEFYRQAVERVPRDAVFWTNVAKAHHTLAVGVVESGRDPTADLEKASEALRQALELNPRLGSALRYRAETRATRARWLARQGKARGEDFEAAAQAFQQALEINPDWPEYRLATSVLHRDWAKWLAAVGGDPAPLLRQSLTLVDETLARRSQWAQARATRASILLMLADSPAPAAQQEAWRTEARSQLDQALARNPNLIPEWGALLASR